jgi:hypothetical protein
MVTWVCVYGAGGVSLKGMAGAGGVLLKGAAGAARRQRRLPMRADAPPLAVGPLPAALSSARNALQLALCAGHMRAVHSVSQKRATRHLEHVLSLRTAPQPTQHADTTLRLPAKS